jgi:hypothetical protein
MKLFFSMYGLKFSRSKEFKPFKLISKQLLKEVTISPMWQPFLESSMYTNLKSHTWFMKNGSITNKKGV